MNISQDQKVHLRCKHRQPADGTAFIGSRCCSVNIPSVVLLVHCHRGMPKHLHCRLRRYPGVLHKRVAGLSQVMECAGVQTGGSDQPAEPFVAGPIKRPGVLKNGFVNSLGLEFNQEVGGFMSQRHHPGHPGFSSGLADDAALVLIKVNVFPTEATQLSTMQAVIVDDENSVLCFSFVATFINAVTSPTSRILGACCSTAESGR